MKLPKLSLRTPDGRPAGIVRPRSLYIDIATSKYVVRWNSSMDAYRRPVMPDGCREPTRDEADEFMRLELEGAHEGTGG